MRRSSGDKARGRILPGGKGCELELRVSRGMCLRQPELVLIRCLAPGTGGHELSRPLVASCVCGA